MVQFLYSKTKIVRCLAVFSAVVALSGFALFAHAEDAAPGFLSQDLSLGSEGPEVTLLQHWLAEDKSLYPEGTVNGKYGSATQAAVKRYQEEKKIILKTSSGKPAYGMVGPMTRANLNADFSDNRGGIATVEAPYGDALVFEKKGFTPVVEKKFQANQEILGTIQAWVYPAEPATRKAFILSGDGGYGFGVTDSGNLYAVAPGKEADAVLTSLTEKKWQHVSILFTATDAVFILNNEVAEIIPLTTISKPNFLENLFSKSANYFQALFSLSIGRPSSDGSGTSTIPAPRIPGWFTALITTIEGWFGIVPHATDSGTGAQPTTEVSVIPMPPATTTETKSAMPLFPKIPVSPVLTPAAPTTTIIVTSTTTASTTVSATTTATTTTEAHGGAGGAPIDPSAPVITLLGSDTVSVSDGSVYNDPGATAKDLEDGTISNKIVVGGDTVNYNLPATYHITYNVTDSSLKAAITVTRIVTVTPPTPVAIGDQTPTYTLAPAGQDVSYSVSSGPNSDPTFSSIDINPLHVYVGDMQTLTVTVSSPGGVKSVQADTQLDTKDVTLNLVKQSESGDTATFSTSWVVYDTHTRKYETRFTATGVNHSTNSVTMAWSDPCTGITQGSPSTASANCTVSTIYGLDGANLTVGAATTITLNGGTWVFNPGTSVTIASGGSFAKGSGGTIKKGYLFYLTATPVDTNTMYFFDSTPQTGYTTVGTYSQSTYYAQSAYYNQLGYCFAPDTLVRMADGSEKPIKDVAVGDWVLGQNEQGVREPNLVGKTFVHDYTQSGPGLFGMLKLNGSLVVRPEHPLFTMRGLVNAGDLHVGDTLIGLLGLVPVVSIEKGPSLPAVYNLEVYPDHDYFAGGVLVHNKLHQNVNPP